VSGNREVVRKRCWIQGLFPIVITKRWPTRQDLRLPQLLLRVARLAEIRDLPFSYGRLMRSASATPLNTVPELDNKNLHYEPARRDALLREPSIKPAACRVGLQFQSLTQKPSSIHTLLSVVSARMARYLPSGDGKGAQIDWRWPLRSKGLTLPSRARPGRRGVHGLASCFENMLGMALWIKSDANLKLLSFTNPFPPVRCCF
jgi:hypothetical protein